jgi:glycosyltransferase involved in cell wall biosynthesis
MNVVSILTPTYNRAVLLSRLFDSLCSQSNKSFNWVIIDDGSTDGTEEEVNGFKQKSDFEIIYKKKDNGGKHTALNIGYKYINSPLTFIVDSDDYLTHDAIQIIINTYENYKDEQDVCGFSFLRATPSGKYLSSSAVPEQGMKESFVDCRINRHISGDMAEVWYTRCLKEFPFPEFIGEKFLGEDIIWIRMSEKYKMRFFNNVIYVSDYLNDGLTKNRRVHNISSPKGCMARAEAFLCSDANSKAKIKAMLQYCIYGHFAGCGPMYLFKGSNLKGLFLLLFVPAQIIYLKWKLFVKE